MNTTTTRGFSSGTKTGRTIVSPPAYGYEDQGSSSGKIPGGATLHFEVELVSRREPEKKMENMFADLDTNGDDAVDATEILAYFHIKVRHLNGTVVYKIK